MFEYNVTFIADYFHVTTTVHVVENDDVEAIEAAYAFLMNNLGMPMDQYKYVDIEADYVGFINNV